MDRVFIFILGKEIFEVVFDEEIFLVENRVIQRVLYRHNSSNFANSLAKNLVKIYNMNGLFKVKLL